MVQLQGLCTGLERLGLPSAIADLNEQRFVAWNAVFLEQADFSESEMSMVTVSSTIVVTNSTILNAGGPGKYSAGLIPCIVRAALVCSVAPGYIQRSQDGFLHIILGSSRSITERDFEYLELVGREKERIRIQQIFHDDVFSPILTAVFAITAAKDATNAAEQTEFLQNASDLLISTFEMVGAALEGKDSVDRRTKRKDAFPQSFGRPPATEAKDSVASGLPCESRRLPDDCWLIMRCSDRQVELHWRQNE